MLPWHYNDADFAQSAAMVLAKALYDKEKELEPLHNPAIGYVLPEIPLHEARQIMTRADFIQSYDQINVFTISSSAMVRAGEQCFPLGLIFMVLRILLQRRPFLIVPLAFSLYLFRSHRRSFQGAREMALSSGIIEYITEEGATKFPICRFILTLKRSR